MNDQGRGLRDRIAVVIAERDGWTSLGSLEELPVGAREEYAGTAEGVLDVFLEWLRTAEPTSAHVMPARRARAGQTVLVGYARTRNIWLFACRGEDGDWWHGQGRIDEPDFYVELPVWPAQRL